MPDSKISLLNRASQLTGVEPIPIVQNGTTVRTNVGKVKNSKSLSVHLVGNILHEEDVRTMCYTGDDSQYVLAGISPSGNIYRGWPDGQSWELRCSTGSGSVRSMDTIPNSGIILAGTSDGTLWRSSDWGFTWLQTQDPGVLAYIWTIKHIDTTKVLIADGAQIYRSIDSIGQNYTWTQSVISGPVVPTQVLAFAMVNPNLIFAAANDDDNGQGCVLKSIDMGATWTQIAIPNLQTGLVNIIYIQEANALIAGDFNGYFYRSTDLGVTWTEVFYWEDDGDTYPPHSMVYAGGGRVIAGTTWSSMLVESTDFGETWQFLQYIYESTYSMVVCPAQNSISIGSNYNAEIYRVDYKEGASQPASIFIEQLVNNAKQIRLTLDGTTIYDNNLPAVQRSMPPGDTTSQWYWTAKLDNLLGDLSPTSHYAKATSESQDIVWSISWDGDDNNFKWISDGNFVRMWYNSSIYQPQTVYVQATHRGNTYGGYLRIAHNMSNPYGLGYGFYGYTGHGVL